MKKTYFLSMFALSALLFSSCAQFSADKTPAVSEIDGQVTEDSDENVQTEINATIDDSLETKVDDVEIKTSIGDGTEESITPEEKVIQEETDALLTQCVKEGDYLSPPGFEPKNECCEGLVVLQADPEMDGIRGTCVKAE